MKLNYKLTEVYPRVFLVEMKDTYDLSMLFCRAQEFYESNFEEIRGKHFNMLEFIALYSKRRGCGAFTYAQDWAGFNLPGNVVSKLYAKNKIIDFNFYDRTFLKIHKHCLTKNNDYYLIGAETKNKNTIYHELAHAFFYLDPVYRKAVMNIIKSMKPTLLKKIKNYLCNELGYANKTLLDEVHAYTCHDTEQLCECIKLNKEQLTNLDKINKKLLSIFNEKLSTPS
jgi:hypothetical protein